MKYDKMLKRELVALLNERDRTLARERRDRDATIEKCTRKARALTEPTAIATFLRDVIRFYARGQQGELEVTLRDFCGVTIQDAGRIVAEIAAWTDPAPEELTRTERDIIKREHFELTQKVTKQTARSERLSIEVGRARAKNEEIQGLIRSYRQVLGDVLADPDHLMTPSLAATPSEQFALFMDDPTVEQSEVFNDPPRTEDAES